MTERAPAPDRLLLTPAVRERLFEHAREGTEESERSDESVEICGVLGGEADVATDDTDGSDERTARVTDLRTVPNVAETPRFRYDLDPSATVEAIDALERAGLDHLGFYHSHPEGPRGPSRTDEARATWPGYVYLIVSLGEDPAIGAWRWSGESFVQLPVAVEQS